MLALLIAVCVALAAGCKSTPEDQARLWESQLASARKWQARYPKLAPAIEQRVSEARTQAEAAGSGADDAAKAAKAAALARAVEHLAAIVGPLDRHDRSVRAIRRLTKDADLRRRSAADVDRAVRKANKAVSESFAILRQAAPADPASAVRVLENAATRVKVAEGDLRRLRERARRERKSRGGGGPVPGPQRRSLRARGRTAWKSHHWAT